MGLNAVKEAALLSWINRVFPREPIKNITQMDGHRLLELAYRVQGKPAPDLFVPSPNSTEVLFGILQDEFQFSSRQALLMYKKFSEGIELELQIAKVLLVLCYCGFKKYNMAPVDIKTGMMLSSMFHFVEDNPDGLSLDEDLNKFLTKGPVMTFSTSSTQSSCCSPLYTESPFVSRFQNPARVQCQELDVERCSSVSSPVPDGTSTPQLLKRLRKKLAHGANVSKLEKELSDQINIISEKEGLIIQLQHRVDRLLREQEELEKDHNVALLELQEKNESLLHRVYKVVKKYQDLKNKSYQNEKRMHDLMETQALSAQEQKLKSDRLGAQLEKWEQHNKELLQKLKMVSNSLQHYSSRNQEALEIRKSLEKSVQALQLERDQAEAKADLAEKRLQEQRKVIDDLETVHSRPGFRLHGLNTLEKLVSFSSVKSRRAKRYSNSQAKLRPSVTFIIPNTPKRRGGCSLLRRGHEDVCRTPAAAHGTSPQASALRKTLPEVLDCMQRHIINSETPSLR